MASSRSPISPSRLPGVVTNCEIAQCLGSEWVAARAKFQCFAGEDEGLVEVTQDPWLVVPDSKARVINKVVRRAR